MMPKGVEHKSQYLRGKAAVLNAFRHHRPQGRLFFIFSLLIRRPLPSAVTCALIHYDRPWPLDVTLRFHVSFIVGMKQTWGLDGGGTSLYEASRNDPLTTASRITTGSYS